jgi:hypothetical protein
MLWSTCSSWWSLHLSLPGEAGVDEWVLVVSQQQSISLSLLMCRLCVTVTLI